MSTEDLRVGDAGIATYVTDPPLDIRLGPRPYLHPVRTLGGVPVTEALPFDHPWHLGASLAMQDVNGVNFWGGRTYVRDQGYTWLDDHGRIAPDGAGFRWQDQAGTTLLTEERKVSARVAPGGWELSFQYALSAPATRDVTLGSPATNGRPGGAGYGGFFWRAAPGDAVAYTQSAIGEEAVNGSADPWLAIRVTPGEEQQTADGVQRAAGAYTLVFRGLRDDDRWFVRTGDYIGVCAALAFERPLVIPAGTGITREISVLVADGVAGPPMPPLLRRAVPTPARPAAAPR
ncbi:PmoA family protein [Winogradskya humida]|uniref:Oxidoreductase n=1 Tax=Winogradskya humida TaxID=113566 RepID=A0ABQ3ZY81_9ACTN|nr:PmoA family protein [Actinoplanes humidus]GIE23363.1 oxidoreductase [Actinoplanes humidus]